MALYSQTRLGELYKLIQKDNPQYTIPFSTSNITVGTPTALTGDTKNTKVTLTGIKYKGYRNANTVKYNRIDLATLTKNTNLKFQVTDGATRTLYAVLPVINAQLGVFLEEGDFADAPLVQTGASYTGSFTLNANHPIYIGSLSFVVEGFTFDLDTIIPTRELDVVSENGPKTAGKINPSVLTYGIDYTAATASLAALTQGTTPTAAQLKALAAALSGIDGFSWRYTTTASEFNLYGATVVSNGIPTQAGTLNTPSPDLSYDRVLCLGINSTYCTNLSPVGAPWVLMLHYDIIKE